MKSLVIVVLLSALGMAVPSVAQLPPPAKGNADAVLDGVRETHWKVVDR